MPDNPVPTSWSLFARTRGVGLLLRIMVATSPLASLGCVRMVGDRALPAVEIVVICLAVFCAVVPDSHLGLLVVLLVGVDWWGATHDATTPWSLVVAASLAVFHIASAAATVAPPSARWTSAMCRRWLRRSAALMVSGPAVWALSVAVDRADVGSSAVMLAAALAVLALAGLWVRDGSLGARQAPRNR